MTVLGLSMGVLDLSVSVFHLSMSVLGLSVSVSRLSVSWWVWQCRGLSFLWWDHAELSELGNRLWEPFSSNSRSFEGQSLLFQSSFIQHSVFNLLYKYYNSSVRVSAAGATHSLWRHLFVWQQPVWLRLVWPMGNEIQNFVLRATSICGENDIHILRQCPPQTDRQ